MGEAVLVSYARTAFGKFGGALRDVAGVELAATAIKGALVRSSLDPAEVEEVFEADELPRRETTLETLGNLPTIYGSPTVTAGNAPGLDAGAAALVVMSEAEACRRGVRPLARLLSYAAVALQPRRMAEAPAAAAECALKRAGLPVASLDRIEINEAFAAVALVSTKRLAGDGAAALAALREKTNADGGAIAIGHPVGASGARIVGTLAMALRRRGGGRGLAAICGGLAQGDAAVLEAAG